MTDAYVLHRLARLRPRRSIVVEEAPSSRRAMHDYLPFHDPDTFYTCASGGLGHGLPAAIGIALGRPREKVIALLGDGSAMYAIQGLWSAAQLGLPITFVILNNRRYEALVEFGRHFGLQRTVGTDLPAIDFCGLARAQGLSAMTVTSAGELDGALTTSLSQSEASLVEIMID